MEYSPSRNKIGCDSYMLCSIKELHVSNYAWYASVPSWQSDGHRLLWVICCILIHPWFNLFILRTFKIDVPRLLSVNGYFNESPDPELMLTGNTIQESWSRAFLLTNTGRYCVIPLGMCAPFLSMDMLFQPRIPSLLLPGSLEITI